MISARFLLDVLDRFWCKLVLVLWVVRKLSLWSISFICNYHSTWSSS